MKKEEAYSFELLPEAYGWYMVFPKESKMLCIGLNEKYVGSLAIESVKGYQVVLKEKGTVAWFAIEAPKEVLVDGIDMTENVVMKTEYLYELNLSEEAGKCVIHIK